MPPVPRLSRASTVRECTPGSGGGNCEKNRASRRESPPADHAGCKVPGVGRTLRGGRGGRVGGGGFIGVGGGRGEFGGVNALVFIYGEEEIVVEGVAAVNALAAPVEINFGGMREPELEILLAEVDGAVFDGGVFGDEVNFRNALDKIGFEANDLVGVRRDPRTAAQGDRIKRAESADAVTAIGDGFVRTLAEMN